MFPINAFIYGGNHHGELVPIEVSIQEDAKDKYLQLMALKEGIPNTMREVNYVGSLRDYTDSEDDDMRVRCVFYGGGAHNLFTDLNGRVSKNRHGKFIELMVSYPK
jgi:hypothetical protein